MLDEVHIAGLGVIGEATLEFAPGLNVLTGETGTGKTMVTVALGLALGARSSPSLVRTGAARLSVEARFGGIGGGDQRLAEWAESGEVILSRSLAPDGRSSARVGGRLAPVSVLAEV